MKNSLNNSPKVEISQLSSTSEALENKKTKQSAYPPCTDITKCWDQNHYENKLEE